MKIGLIGAGCAGTAVAGYFKNHGLDVAGFYSRRLEAAVDSAVITDTKAFLDMDELISQCDMLILSVSDDAIRKFAITLGKRQLGHKILCHFSASHPADILDTGAHPAATYLALHPLCSFTDKHPPETLAFTLEGFGPRLAEFQTLCKQKQVEVFSMTSEQNAVFHVALSFLMTFPVTMMGIGRDLLRLAGIKEAAPLQQLLTHAICRAIQSANLCDALPGPIANEDFGALKRQMDVLPLLPPEIANLYLTLSEKTIAYSRLDNYAKQRLRTILQSDTRQ